MFPLGLLVAGIETRKLICKSKFALMVSLPAARRQGDRWFDPIIGAKCIPNFNDIPYLSIFSPNAGKYGPE